MTIHNIDISSLKFVNLTDLNTGELYLAINSNLNDIFVVEFVCVNIEINAKNEEYDDYIFVLRSENNMDWINGKIYLDHKMYTFYLIT